MGEITKKPIDRIKNILKADSVMEQFRNCLGNHADAFVASVIDCVNTDSALLECNPGQLIAECLKAATLKLPLNKGLGMAYVVAYNNSKKLPTGEWVKVKEPTFQIGYKGYIQLAQRTAAYKRINAGVVYKGQFVGINNLTGELNINGKKESDEIVGYFAYFQKLNGYEQSAYMTIDEMAKHALKFSKTFIKKEGKYFVYKNKTMMEVTIEQLKNLANSDCDESAVGWMGNFNAMAQKTMLRNLLSKWGELSVEDKGQTIINTEMNEKAVDDEDFTDAIDVTENETFDPETGEVLKAIDATVNQFDLAEQKETAVETAKKSTKAAKVNDLFNNANIG